MMNIGKLIDFAVAKKRILTKQRSFLHKGYKIRFILEKHDSPKLIVVFSSCTRAGIKARYNYINTLKETKCNKLFILDDYGDDGRGVFYLGHNNDFAIQEGVTALIDKIAGELHIRQRIYIGSSKGGYASLYFGIKDRADIIIAGAPQFNLGTYFNDEGGFHILKYVCGEINEDNVSMLNNLMRNVISKADASHFPVLYLHYSDKEPTYTQEIVDLEKCLDQKGAVYTKDVADYTNHGEISKYFPYFLKQTLKQVGC